MSQLFSRSALALALPLAAWCLGCSSGQKTTNMPEPASPSEPPTPQPGDTAMPAPGGEPSEPTNMPPDVPPPQSLNQGLNSNFAASPTATSKQGAPAGSEQPAGHAAGADP